jgi:hypothetical protein
MHHVVLAYAYVALAQIYGTERLEIEVDRLHERTRAHVVQESLLFARTYERRVHESVHARGGIGERQQRPGPKVPTRCVLLVHIRGASGRGYLREVRRRVECHLVLGKVTGQAPNFFVSVLVKDKKPVVVLDAGTWADVRLQVIV